MTVSCGSGRKLKGVCPVPWLEMAALAPLPGPEQPGLRAFLHPSGPRTPISHPAGSLCCTTLRIPSQLSPGRSICPLLPIFGVWTLFPNPGKLIPVSSPISKLSVVVCHQICPFLTISDPCSACTGVLWSCGARFILGSWACWWLGARQGVGLCRARLLFTSWLWGLTMGDPGGNPEVWGASGTCHGGSTGFG